MAHPKSSYLNLQFMFPKNAIQVYNIQKTIKFVNTIAEICSIMKII